MVASIEPTDAATGERAPRAGGSEHPTRSIATLVGVSCAAAVLLGSRAFFVSNQNTYLLHAVGRTIPDLESDWLLGTTDAFPLFTAVSGLFYRTLDRFGLILLSVGLGLVAFVSIAAISLQLLRSRLPADRAVHGAALTTLCVAGSAVLLPRWAPDGLPLVGTARPFDGFGGQYLLSVPGIVQPSDSGTLLLASAALAISARDSPSHQWRWLLSAGLAVVACSLHPSYLAPLAVGLGAMAVADLATGDGWRRLPLYTAVWFTSAAFLLLTNPVARSARNGSTDAREYISFVRVPHHTLVSEWSRPHTVGLSLVVVLAAVLSRRLLGHWWVAIVMITCLVTSLLAAVFVEITRSSPVASVFPWRASVLLAPVAFTVVAAFLVQLLLQHVRRAVDPYIVVGASLVAVWFGITITVDNASDPQSRVVRELADAPPSGVGLIPLDLLDVRLNAGVPVFVDWKSHPYESGEVLEWIRRVELVREVERDASTACAVVDSEGLDWALFRDAAAPDCLSAWSAREAGEYTIFTRPAPGGP